MKLKVVSAFADKFTNKMYGVGEIITLPVDRASVAIERGLAVEIAEAKPEKKETKKKPKKKEG
jgi:hypothetical protein